jgi:hypothetical protein
VSSNGSQLRDQGIVTNYEEFEAKKKQIFGI